MHAAASAHPLRVDVSVCVSSNEPHGVWTHTVNVLHVCTIPRDVNPYVCIHTRDSASWFRQYRQRVLLQVLQPHCTSVIAIASLTLFCSDIGLVVIPTDTPAGTNYLQLDSNQLVSIPRYDPYCKLLCQILNTHLYRGCVCKITSLHVLHYYLTRMCACNSSLHVFAYFLQL